VNRNMRSDLLAAACSNLERRDDGSVSQDFRFNEDFIGFAGHFPGYPIVPAVAQLLAAQVVVEQCEAAPRKLREVSHAKFLQQLLPGQTFRVRCQEKADKPHNFDAKIFLGEELAASFRLVFAARETNHG